MRTISFVTKYEGESKIYFLKNANLAGIVSTVATSVDLKKCEKILANITNNVQPFEGDIDISEFKKLLDSEILQLDGAFALISSDNVFCVTYGTGAIFVRRSGHVYPLVEAGKYAKGKVLEGDEFVMTTSEYLDFVGGMDGFKYYFNKYSASEVCEMMETYEDQSNPSGFVALSLSENNEESDEDGGNVGPTTGNIDSPFITSELRTEIDISDEKTGEIITEKLGTRTAIQARKTNIVVWILQKMRSIDLKYLLRKSLDILKVLQKFGLKKAIYSIVIICILFFLVSKIPFGQIFRDKDKEFTKFESTIKGYISDADTASFGETTEVSKIISKARSEIDNLPEVDKKQFASQIKNLTNELDDKEHVLLKFADKPLDEYYSIDLLGNDVDMQDIDSDSDDLAILNAKQGMVYIINTEKRVQSNITSNKLIGATQVSIYEGRVYVLTKTDGIYRIETDRSKRVVEKSNDWGNIVDMKVYASNIYLLDSQKGDILKYPGIDEDTFGNDVPYLVEESRGTLTNAQKMYIGGPIYVFGWSTIAKYISGKEVDFELYLPYSDGSLTAVAISEESKYVYAFDAKQKALFEYDEDLIFKKQYKDAKLEDTQGVYSTKNGVFLVTKDRIFQVPQIPIAP